MGEMVVCFNPGSITKKSTINLQKMHDIAQVGPHYNFFPTNYEHHTSFIGDLKLGSDLALTWQRDKAADAQQASTVFNPPDLHLFGMWRTGVTLCWTENSAKH